MTLELFIVLLAISAIATPTAVQIMKNFMDKIGMKYKSVPLAIVIALIVGFAEIFVYYGTHDMIVTFGTIIYAICLGIANAVGATTSYDLVKKFINALFGK